jgi:hypothetical protein
LIESGRVRPFPEAARRAGIEQDVMEDVQLCDSTGGYRYEVEVLRQGRRERTEMPAEIPTAGGGKGAGREGNNGHGNDVGRNDGSNPGTSNTGDRGSDDGSPGRSGESNGAEKR